MVVKADWRRAEFGLTLPTYDTSAAALSERLAAGDVSWTEPQRQTDPGPADIYTLKLPNGNVFRLAALHIMTKELDALGVGHAVVVGPARRRTSAPIAPQPFRPVPELQDVRRRSPSTRKMPTGRGYAADASDARGGARPCTSGVGGPTWCSNPYLETGAGNAATNCIGCHQHAGTDIDVEKILGDEAAFPARGRTELRKDFLTDYSYQLSRGDGFGALFRQTEQHFAED